MVVLLLGKHDWSRISEAILVGRDSCFGDRVNLEERIKGAGTYSFIKNAQALLFAIYVDLKFMNTRLLF